MLQNLTKKKVNKCNKKEERIYFEVNLIKTCKIRINILDAY